MIAKVSRRIISSAKVLINRLWLLLEYGPSLAAPALDVRAARPFAKQYHNRRHIPDIPNLEENKDFPIDTNQAE